MKCKIYLFRHGQTHFNKRKMFTGWKDATWTQKGFRNARTVARKLENKHIDIGFSSTLTRSKETLKEVLKHHPECKVIFRDDRMIERCYGKLQGHSHAAFIRQFGEEVYNRYHRAYDFPPPDGESLKMVESRVLPFIKDLLAFIKKYKVNVAISAHGNSMRPFRRYFEKFSLKKMVSLENPYDEYFEYTVNITGTQTKLPTKKDWKQIKLPPRVYLASNKNNPFKKFY